MSAQFKTGYAKRYASRQSDLEEGISDQMLTRLVTEAFRAMYDVPDRFLESLVGDQTPSCSMRF